MFPVMHDDDEVVFSARIISNKLLFPELKLHIELKNTGIEIPIKVRLYEGRST